MGLEDGNQRAIISRLDIYIFFYFSPFSSPPWQTFDLVHRFVVGGCQAAYAKR